MTRLASFIFLLFLTSCAEIDLEKAPLVLKPSSFRELPGWHGDNHIKALNAFARSCDRILKQDPKKRFGPELFDTGYTGQIYEDWQTPCRVLREDTEPANARLFFEQNFVPYKAYAGKRHAEGLFTGYYEASLKGSLTPGGAYKYPLLRRPDDLVMVDLGDFRDELKGQRIAGRVIGAHLKPYEDRAAIDGWELKNTQDLALAWVDNPVDAFFLHIQGSGRVILQNDRYMRLGYDGQNGHPYYAIGRELIHRGHLEKEEVSMQSIREWLEKNPVEAADVMNTNKSYIFFRLLEEEGPLGGEGTVLTPGRSLAIDRTKIPYGVPLWLDLEPALEDGAPVQRLMVAQDTGGAIRGPVRGDVFWGYGPQAKELAGHMKSQGGYWLLLPKTNPDRLRFSQKTQETISN